jgi:hypothetical protein
MLKVPRTHNNFTEAETGRRFEAALRGAFKTPWARQAAVEVAQRRPAL